MLSEREKPQEPQLKIRIVSDTTMEALAEIMHTTPRGGPSYNDEFAGWIKRFNRYNSGGEQELWLSLWSGKPVIVNRKKAGSFRIDNPFMCVAGTIPNRVLSLVCNDKMANNGFAHRILFAFPDESPKEA